MTHPVFFSLGGTHDKAFAEEVKTHFADHLVYLYNRTGNEGANIQREIEKEISRCLIFVVFWSQDYLASEYATWELAFFKKLYETANSEVQLIIAPTRSDNISPTTKWTNPLSQREEFALGRWRLERSIDEGSDAEMVAEHIKRRLNESSHGTDVLVSRPHVQNLIKNAASAENYRFREVVFVSGFEGDGRRTAVEQYMYSSHRHLIKKSVPFDSLDGPEDLLPRLMHANGVAIADARAIVDSIAEGKTTAEKEVRKLVHSFRTQKIYLLCAMDRFAAVDLSIWLPNWVPKLFSVFQEGVAPIVFFVTSSAVKESDLRACPTAGLARVPGLDEREMTQLVFSLADIDPNPARWDKKKKELVATIAGSSPALAQLIMRKAAFEQSLEYLEDLARREEDRFAEGLTAILSMALDNYRERKTDLLALLIIERLGVVTKQAIDLILNNFGAWDLFGFLELGLLERLSDDLLRIPPLLQRRLGYLLLNTELAAKADELIKNFGEAESDIVDNFGPVFLVNKAAAALRSGAEPESQVLKSFITLSMLARAGMERYGLEDWEGAHSILTRAFEKLIARPKLDLSVKIEIARFFGLAAARVKNRADVDRACEYLRNDAVEPRRQAQGEAMAHFLRGFELRLRAEFDAALQEFQAADRLLNGVKHADRQHGAVLSELSRTLIKLRVPRYDEAVATAQRAYDAKDVAHNLNALIRARIARLASWNGKGVGEWHKEEKVIRDLIGSLANISRRIGREFDLVRLAELEFVLSLRACSKLQKPLDLSISIKTCTRALQIRIQPSTKLLLWKAQLLHQLRDYSSQIQRDAERIRASAPETSRRREDAEKMIVLCKIKKTPTSAIQYLQTIPWANQLFRKFAVDFAEHKLKRDPRLMTILDRL